MTLTDSGPLAAMLNRQDQWHIPCAAAAPRLSSPLVTTMPCLTEALYFLGRDIGWHAQSRLWQLVEDGRLEVCAHSPEDLRRMRALMAKYRDAPMDLADASLVVLADNLNAPLIFTVDSHFRGYRMRDRRVFRLVPEIG